MRIFRSFCTKHAWYSEGLLFTQTCFHCFRFERKWTLSGYGSEDDIFCSDWASYSLHFSACVLKTAFSLIMQLWSYVQLSSRLFNPDQLMLPSHRRWVSKTWISRVCEDEARALKWISRVILWNWEVSDMNTDKFLLSLKVLDLLLEKYCCCHLWHKHSLEVVILPPLMLYLVGSQSLPTDW